MKKIIRASIEDWESAALRAKASTDPVELDSLSYHPSGVVRDAVAANPNTSDETFERLTYDKDVKVRNFIKSRVNRRVKTDKAETYKKKLEVDKIVDAIQSKLVLKGIVSQQVLDEVTEILYSGAGLAQ